MLGVKEEFFNPDVVIQNGISRLGGYVNAHSHIDRAFSLTANNFYQAEQGLMQKWTSVDEMKARISVAEIETRMHRALEDMALQGVKTVASFIDVDPVIGDKALIAARNVKEEWAGSIQTIWINQVLKGVLDPEAKAAFMDAMGFVDAIGGLPAKDVGREEDHLDFIMDQANRLGKMVHVHVDQNDDPREREMELLIRKTIEHQLQGRVVAVHSVSIAAQPQEYREKIYTLMAENQIMVISCPTAWIDRRRNETLAPIHNSITPIDEMVRHGIVVAVGTDNIRDIYKPFTDGSMWTELQFLIQALHFYDIDQVVKIATTNGLKALGLLDYEA